MAAQALSVARNDYVVLPDEVYRLTALTSLDASGNNMEAVGNLIAQALAPNPRHRDASRAAAEARAAGCG